jgi:hypothetical protein
MSTNRGAQPLCLDPALQPVQEVDRDRRAAAIYGERRLVYQQAPDGSSHVPGRFECERRAGRDPAHLLRAAGFVDERADAFDLSLDRVRFGP